MAHSSSEDLSLVLTSIHGYGVYGFIEGRVEGAWSVGVGDGWPT